MYSGVNGGQPYQFLAGNIGTIICMRPSRNCTYYDVEFDDYIKYLHTCGGKCDVGHGWVVEESYLNSYISDISETIFMFDEDHFDEFIEIRS